MTDTTTPSQYLTAPEVAEILAVDVSSVHRWRTQGQLPCIQHRKRFFYDRAQVEAMSGRIGRTGKFAILRPAPPVLAPELDAYRAARDVAKMDAQDAAAEQERIAAPSPTPPINAVADMLATAAKVAELHRVEALTRDLLAIGHEAAMEARDAAVKWPPFNSAHEGFAVLDEERDELWDHVKVNQKHRDLPAMRKEALQVAAMALRFVHDVCDADRGRV
jgi:hypothetical protein